MPRFVVTATDGRTFDVNAPEGATQDDILQYVQSQLGGTPARRREPQESEEDIAARLKPERGFLGAAGAGLSRNLTQLGSLVGDVLPALGASALGFDDYAKRQMQEAADTEAEIQRTNPAQFQSLSDVKGPGDWLPFLGETLGEQGGNLLTSIGTGGVGSMIAKGLAKKAAEKELVGLATQRLGNAAEKELVKRTAAAEGLAPEFAAAPAEMVAAARGAAATPEAVSSIIPALPEYGAALRSAAGTGAVVGAGAASVGMNTGEIFQNIYENTGELAPTAAVVGGALAGALDTVLPAKFLRIFRSSPPELKAEIIKKIAEAKQAPFAMAKLIGKGAVKDFGLEAATEGAQEAISIAAERFVENTQGAWGAPEFDRIFESSIRGGIAGGAFGAVEGAGEGLRERGIRREEEERKTTEEAKAKAEKDAEARRLTEAQRVLEIPTELTDLRAKIEAFQASPEAKTRVGEFDLQEMLDQEQKLKDDLELFNTPEDKREELLKKRAGTTTATTAPAPNKPLEEYTVANLFHQIGITQKDASAALGAYNRDLAKNSPDRIEFRKGKDLSYEVPAVGENAEKFRRFVSSVLNPDKVESLQTADKETKRAFRQRLDDVLGNNPKVQGHPTLTDEHIANAKAVQSTEDLSATDIDSVSRVISKRLGAILPSVYPEEWYRRLTNLRAQAEAAGNADLVKAVDERIATETNKKFSLIPDLLKPAAYTPEGYAYAATNFVKKLNENKDAVIPDHVFKITAKKLGIDSDTLPADREGRIQAIRSVFDAKTQENFAQAKQLIENTTTQKELTDLAKEGGGLHGFGFRVFPNQKTSIAPVELNNQIRTEFNKKQTALKPTTPRGKANLSPEELEAKETAKSNATVQTNLRKAKLAEIKNKIKDTIAGFETGQSGELKEYWESLTDSTMFDEPGFVLGPKTFKEIISDRLLQYNNKLRNLQNAEKNAKSAVSPEQAEINKTKRQEKTRIGEVKKELLRNNKKTINDLKNSALPPATKLTRLEELWNRLNTDIEAKAAAAKIPVDSYNNFLTELRAVYDPAVAYADSQLQTEKFRKETAEANKLAAEAKVEADRLAAEAKKAEEERLAAEAKKAEADNTSPVEKPEIIAAKEFYASIANGGIPLKPDKFKKHLEAFGLEYSKKETPAVMIQRLKTAIDRHNESLNLPPLPEFKEETPTGNEAPTGNETLTKEQIDAIKEELGKLYIKKSGRRPAPNTAKGNEWDAWVAKLRSAGVPEDQIPPDVKPKESTSTSTSSKPPRGKKKVEVADANTANTNTDDTAEDNAVIYADPEIQKLLDNFLAKAYDVGSITDRRDNVIPSNWLRTIYNAVEKIAEKSDSSINDVYDNADEASIKKLIRNLKVPLPQLQERQLGKKPISQTELDEVVNLNKADTVSVGPRPVNVKGVAKSEVKGEEFIAPQEFEDAVKGKSLLEVASWLVNNVPDQYSDLAYKVLTKLRAMQKAGHTFDFQIRNKDTKNFPDELKTSYGLAEPHTNGDMTVWLNGADMGNLSGVDHLTLLHELLHAATMMENFVRPNADLQNLFDAVKAEFEKRMAADPNYLTGQALVDVKYGLSNPDEFLSVGQTNPVMQDFLQSIPYKNENRSMLSKFVEMVLRLLGFDPKKDSAFKELMHVTEDILSHHSEGLRETQSGAEAFSEDAFRNAFRGVSDYKIPDYKSRYKLIEMPINDFLAIAEDDFRQEKYDDVLALFKKGVKFNDIPELTLFRDKNGDLKATGHDGRHRARVLRDNGYDTIPVKLLSDIRWSEQLDPKNPDYEKKWPSKIISQDGTKSIPMPVPREQSMTPYAQLKSRASQAAPEEAPKPYEIRPPLTKVAVAVNEALSPRERVENSTTLAQNADKVYNKVFGALDNLIDKLPVWSQEFARKVLDYIQNLGENAKKFVMNLGSLDQLTDIAKLVNVDLAKAIQQVKSAVTDRNAIVDGYKERIEKLVNRARRIMKKYSAAVSKEFNDIVHESTLGEIDFDDKKQYADPSKPKEMDAAKRREWEKLSARFNALPADMQQLYRDLRDEYQLYSNKFADLIKDASDSVGALSTGNKVLLQLMNRKIYPYFPLFRKGDYWLRFSVKDQKTGGYVDNVMAFESLGERRRFIANDLKNEDVAKLKDGRLDIQEFSRFGDVDINNLPPTSQFREMIKLLKESNVEEKVLNQVFKAYLDMFPTNSVMQQFRKRKGTAGYKDDAIGNFIDVGTRMALNVAQFSSSKAIDEAMKAARAAAGGGTGTETEKAIMGSLSDRERYLKSPMQKTGFDRFAAWAGLNSYRYFILGNISSAVVNLTQPFLTTLPLLSGRYGMGEAIRAMNEARRMYWKGGSDSNTESISPFTGRVMTDFTFGGDKSNLSPQMKRLYDKAVLAGAIRRSTGQDLMDMRSDGVKDPSSPFGIVHRVNTSLGWVFQNSERANREVSLLAAHNLELKRLLAKGVSQSKAEELAIEGAIRLVEEANGSAMSETGPEFFQHGFGKLIGTFKRFALSQIYLVSKLAAKSLVGASKEEKRIAAKQLGYIYGNAFIFAGAKGMPFFGAVNLFSSMIAGLFGDDEPFDLEEEILRGPGNWFLRGPLGAAANIDLGSRTGFADLLWRDDPKRLADLGPMTYMLEMAGGPIMGVGKNIQSGYDLIRQGQVGRGIETMLPAVARNLMKTLRYTVDGVENRNGVKLVDDPNAYNLAMQLVGFNRNDLADVYARNSIMKTIERKDSERRANLLDRYDYARQEHDYDGMADLKEEMREYGRTGLGRTHPITSEVLQQSMKNRETKRRQMEQTSGAYYGKPNSAKVRYLEERAGVE